MAESNENATASAFETDAAESIRSWAMSFPETAEGASCVNRAFSAGGKNFVFVGEKGGRVTVRLKLQSGWTKLEFDADDAPPLDELEAKISESFFLLAPQRVQAMVENIAPRK